MERTLYNEDHLAFAESFDQFIARELAPHYLEWEEAGISPRSIFTEAGKYGFLGFQIPEKFGGGGTDDYRFNAIVAERLQYAGMASASTGITLHNDITIPYFLELGTDEQKERWLPGIASGELITAIGMTEPGAGSDLAGMGTSAIRDGDCYIVNGSKTFITNGINADLIVTAVKTDPSQRHTGMSLIVMERGMEGFERGRNLDKVGLHSQDTAELFFNDVKVPASNLLGEEGQGFKYLTVNLPQERLNIAVAAVAAAQAALNWTVEYVKERKAFGAPISSFQNTKFVLASVKTEIDAAQAYVDKCIELHNLQRLTAADAAAAKFHCTELQKRSIDSCLQLFGGYGYMMEYPIARAYIDARITTIYGGTTEVMKGIIAKSMGL